MGCMNEVITLSLRTRPTFYASSEFLTRPKANPHPLQVPLIKFQGRIFSSFDICPRVLMNGKGREDHVPN